MCVQVLEAVDGQKLLAKYAGPGAFNDPDMLVVGLDGMYPYGMVQRCPPTVPDCKPGEYISRERWGMVGGLSFREQRAHFSLWAIMAAPLLLGNDPRDMTPETRELLTAPEVCRLPPQRFCRLASSLPCHGWMALAQSPLTAEGCREPMQSQSSLDYIRIPGLPSLWLLSCS